MSAVALHLAHDGWDSIAAEHLRWWRRAHPDATPAACAREIGANNVRAWDECHDAYVAAWLGL